MAAASPAWTLALPLALSIACLTSGLTAGCAQAPQRVEENAGVAIVWNRTTDTKRVCEQVAGRKEFFNILGCAHWDDDRSASAGSSSTANSAATPAASSPANSANSPSVNRVCTIYAPEPRDERDTQRFATLGHELMHCFNGQWHDRYGNKN